MSLSTTALISFLFTHLLMANTLFKTDPDGTTYVSFGQANDSFEASVIREPNGRMQDLIEKKVFQSKTSLDQYLAQFSDFQPLDQSLRTIPQDTYTEVRNQKIWTARNQWTEEWEDRYAAWITENVDENFYTRYNMETDCADVAFSLRWIFARIHSLPAANRLEGSRRVFSNESMRSSWTQLPTHQLWYRDRRFLAAVNYVMGFTSTRTIAADSYPVAMNVNSLKPGVFYYLGGHTKFVYRSPLADLRTPLSLIESTVPRKVRVLRKGVFNGSQYPEGRGFRQFRWVYKNSNGYWIFKEGTTMEHYSLEQHSNEFVQGHSSFSAAVHASLYDNMEEVVGDILSETLTSIGSKINERIQIVEDGYRVCQRENCREGSENYENWSTNSRDSRLKTSIKNLINDFNYFKNMSPTVEGIWRERTNAMQFQLNNRIINSIALFKRLLQENFSPDPRTSVLRRWGESSFQEYQGEYREVRNESYQQNYSSFLGHYDVVLRLSEDSDVQIETFNGEIGECTVDSTVQVFSNINGNLEQVGYDDDGGIERCSDLSVRLAAGDYIVRLNGYSNSKVFGQYKVSVSN